MIRTTNAEIRHEKQQIIETPTTSFESSSSSNKKNHGKFERSSNVPIEMVWKCFLQKYSNTTTNKNKNVVMEVGMHRIVQCSEAASMGYEAHCFEPSPLSFRKIQQQHQRLQSEETKNNIHLYNVAAGSETGTNIEFYSGGSTGDSVGNMDWWKMEERKTKSNKTVVQVPSVKLDDIIAQQITPDRTIVMAKIDTQGYEPNIMEGLQKTIQSGRIKIILLEYWPKGMDTLLLNTNTNANTATSSSRCKASVHILHMLYDAGYKLYAMNVERHPTAKSFARLRVLRTVTTTKRSLTNFMDNCQFYYHLEETIFPHEEYKMGYWSDVVALAPNEDVSNCV